MLVTGCQDNEQIARAAGAEVRPAVASRCAASATAPDDPASARDACIDEACRAECAKRAVPHGFEAACSETCREAGVCATTADCGPGHQCIAIAPRVRRCQPAP